MVIEVTFIPIGENYLIVDRGGAAYIGELGNAIKSHISIYIPIWCGLECPVQ